VEAQSSELIQPHPAYPPLRILIDGRKLGDGGIGVYLENLINGLLTTDEVEVSVLASAAKREEFSTSLKVNWVIDPAKPYSIDEMLFLSRRVDFSSFDLYHAPHYILPFGIPIPRVVTIHDLIHISHPARFFYPTIARCLVHSATRRADAIIAVSRDTRAALIETTHVPSNKLRVIPNAIPTIFELRSRAKVASRRFCELSPFFVTVLSNIKPHKGLPDLIAAYAMFRKQYQAIPDAGSHGIPKLVLAGFGTEEIFQSNELLALLGEVEGIHVLGRVSAEELAVLYRKAISLIVPSLAEGFCLPALEAQASGGSVICRPIPALHEIVTDRDVVANDFSIAALAQAMLERMRLPRLLSQQIDESHFHRFTQAFVTEQTLDVYRNVTKKQETRRVGGVS